MITNLFRKLATSKIYLIFTLVITALTFTQWFVRVTYTEGAHHWQIHEQYSSELEYLNTLNKLSDHIDSLAVSNGVNIQMPNQYVRLIDNTIRDRFCHGTSRIDFHDNFIAWIMGNLVWSHFTVGVAPDEILTHPNALCSQSAIVFQELVKMKGFKVRAVGLQRHFCSEVYYEGAWHFVDSDKEPIFDDNEPIPSLEELSKDEKLIAKAYLKDTGEVSLEELREIFDEKEILFFNENEFPAKNMRLFQEVSEFLSNCLWMILFIPMIFAWSRPE